MAMAKGAAEVQASKKDRESRREKNQIQDKGPSPGCSRIAKCLIKIQAMKSIRESEVLKGLRDSEKKAISKIQSGGPQNDNHDAAPI